MIAKFPPQHRNRCYCQSRRQCIQKIQPPSKNVNQPIFVKAQPTRHSSPAQLSEFDSPASNMFRSTLTRTIDQHCDALATEINTKFHPIEHVSTHPYYTNQRVNYDRHSSSIQLPSANAAAAAAPLQQVKCSTVGCYQQPYQTADRETDVQSKHKCQIRYLLNERNQPVPVGTPSEDGNVSCCLCEKSFPPLSTINITKPDRIIYQDSGSSISTSDYSQQSTEAPSMILEIKSPQDLVFRSVANSRSLVNIQLRKNEIPVRSLALKYQRRY